MISILLLDGHLMCLLHGNCICLPTKRVDSDVWGVILLWLVALCHLPTSRQWSPRVLGDTITASLPSPSVFRTSHKLVLNIYNPQYLCSFTLLLPAKYAFDILSYMPWIQTPSPIILNNTIKQIGGKKNNNLFNKTWRIKRFQFLSRPHT